MEIVNNSEIINKDNFTYFKEDPSLDYMPTEEEKKLVSMMKNSKRRHENSDKNVKKRAFNDYIENFIRTESKDYDSLGRNIKAQRSRQEKVPWVKVRYVNGRLFIPEDKKQRLKELGIY